MSCGSCDCEECMNDMDEEDEEVPSIPFGRLPPPPPFHRSTDEFRVAMHSVFDQYPTARINMPAVIAIMMQRLNVKPHEFKEAEAQILGFIKGQVDAGALNMTKGRMGGIMRNSPSEQIEVKKTIAGPVYSVGASPLQSAKVAPAINDHTCLGCGNTSCSKSEKSCWKCGHPIA